MAINDLNGVGVLVTRPSGQADTLCKLIAEHGGRSVCFPTIAIGSAQNPSVAEGLLQRVADYQIVIFISPNAVKYGLELMGNRAFPVETKICAVGKSTARLLVENGIEVDISPEGQSDSESLLALPELIGVAGKHVLIFRGNGGRKLLGDTLRERGAIVDYAEVYSRSIPSADANPLLASWDKEVDIVTVTSIEILENLFSLLGEEGRAMVYNTPLVVVSERIMVRAQELGCGNIILADEASDWGLLKAVSSWAENRP